MHATRSQWPHRHLEHLPQPQSAEHELAFKIGGDEGIRFVSLHDADAIQKCARPDQDDSLLRQPITAMGIKGRQVTIAGDTDRFAEHTLIGLELERTVRQREKAEHNLQKWIRK